MDRKIRIISLLSILGMVFSACAGKNIPNRSATFTEIENQVQARSSADSPFVQANTGQQLAVGGEVKSGETGKARLAILPDNTYVYVGPNTLFTLTELDPAGGNLVSRLKLDFGYLWIVLGGGSLDVETPAGVASVRGSLMGVGVGDGLTTITCLEGHCDVSGGSGTSNLTGGEACDLTPEDPTCLTRPLTGEEEQGWQENVPGSGDFIPPTETFTPTFTPTSTATPQSYSEPGDLGPQLDDFPSGINPLTGLPVTDPSLLDLPAILISIPHFPPSARPQAGLSFAPWIFEIYIGEGMTRFLTTFYGEEPEVTPRLSGSCDVRTPPFLAGEMILGNRAWSDKNGNGIQDSNEPGIGGICISLFDGSGNLLQSTSTDSNGYYGFNVDPGASYQIGFEDPASLDLTLQDMGLDDLDSDANPLTGLTGMIQSITSDMNWDVGYIQVEVPSQPTETVGPGTPTPENPDEGMAALPPAEVGPIRSMRLPYGTIGKFFQGGCIISASGDPSVLARVPGCHYVFGDDSSVNNALLDITQLREMAEQNKKDYPVNYSGNVFSTTPPGGGTAASQVNVFWNWQNQSQFIYDPLSGSYLRYANKPGSEDIFDPQTDRLTGNQLAFDNIIVMYVEHIVYAATMMDIDLNIGQMGRADLFRNGQIYHIYWNTIAQEYEQETQRLRPIRFTDSSGNPVPLKPGHTWVHVFTTASVVYEKQPGSGTWKAEFHAPIP